MEAKGRLTTKNSEVKSHDPFLAQFQHHELLIASEFLVNWLPFLSRDLCSDCFAVLSRNIHSLAKPEQGIVETHKSPSQTKHIFKIESKEPSTSGELNPSNSKMSWADMAAQEEASPADDEDVFDDDNSIGLKTPSTSPRTRTKEKPKLSKEQRENLRLSKVQRNKEFICFERVKGKLINILQGLELHEGIFNAAEQNRIVNFVHKLQEMGSNGKLTGRTYTAPQKWMRGKGRETIQFGCCYNYSTDKNGNPPGIVKSEIVDPMPKLFGAIINRLINWEVLPSTCVPDSCIVNIYNAEDCIPPHIDSHDFERPFCTISFLSECQIVFGANMKILGPGEFEGAISFPLPIGSVLVMNGNSADIAKHCIPSVATKRISITFRKMEERKRPNPQSDSVNHRLQQRGRNDGEFRTHRGSRGRFAS